MESNLRSLINKTDFDNLFQKLGYKYYKNGDYNINIIGIRNLLNGNTQTDQFNDAIVLTYKVNGVWHRTVCDFTTDPGLKLLRAPSNVKGTAILVPGQYLSTYKIDTHNAKYQALCQRLGNVKVYRDCNKDNKLDFNDLTIDEGYFGINIHRASAYTISEVIGGNSAGCQVFKSYVDFNNFMTLIRKCATIYGNKFTYTLITTDQINDPSIKYGVKKVEVKKETKVETKVEPVKKKVEPVKVETPTKTEAKTESVKPAEPTKPVEKKVEPVKVETPTTKTESVKSDK